MSNSPKEKPLTSKLPRWGWYLFDFANSILIINGGLYFPEWITKENGVQDIWFNVTIIISSLLVLVSAPFFGRLYDRRGGRMNYLIVTSLMMFTGGLTIAIAGRFVLDWHWRVCLSLTAFGIIMYAYQLSLVFYNLLLGQVALPSKRAAVSGNGLAWGWIGGIISVFVIYPFVQGHIPFFQPAGRIQAILPSTLLYAIFTAISLWLLKRDPHFRQASPASVNQSGDILASILRTIRQLPASGSLFLFIASYFLFSDAILTVQNNSTIYMGRVFELTANTQAIVYVGFLTLAAIGAVFSSKLIGWFGFQKSLIISLQVWIALILVTLFVRDSASGSLLLSFMGFANGMLWNVSRVWFYELAPDGTRGELFGFYTAMERVATFIGPLIWSAIVELPVENQATKYRLALAAMGFLIIMSLIPLKIMKNRFPIEKSC